MINLKNILVATDFSEPGVAERVLRTAPCPVLTVHARERDILEARA